MAYYKPISLVKGDDLPILVITLRDSNVAANNKILSLLLLYNDNKKSS